MMIFNLQTSEVPQTSEVFYNQHGHMPDIRHRHED